MIDDEREVSRVLMELSVMNLGRGYESKAQAHTLWWFPKSRTLTLTQEGTLVSSSPGDITQFLTSVNQSQLFWHKTDLSSSFLTWLSSKPKKLWSINHILNPPWGLFMSTNPPIEESMEKKIFAPKGCLMQVDASRLRQGSFLNIIHVSMYS
jgi:hypothetical protein